MKTRINLAGVQYSDYNLLDSKTILKEVKTNKNIKLVHDKNNVNDKEAIAVLIGDIRIGYIPRGPIKDTMWKARRSGKKVSVKLVTYNPSNPSWYMFTVELDIPVMLPTDNYEQF